ncbi:MAG: hypothetical protein U0R52_11680 [Solirubrobacterales bacterium]
MDADELDELMDSLIGEDATPRPSFRATIRGGQVWIRGWAAEMHTPGEGDPRPVAPDVAIADLTLLEPAEEGPRELIVHFHYRSADGEDLPALIDWATRTGYGRLWLPDGLIPLRIDPERLGEARTECPTCGASWVAGDPAFWAEVLRQGFFPDTCSHCGCGLAEWSS